MSLEELIEEWGRLHLSVTPYLPLGDLRLVSRQLDALWREVGDLAGERGHKALLKRLDDLAKGRHPGEQG